MADRTERLNTVARPMLRSAQKTWRQATQRMRTTRERAATERMFLSGQLPTPLPKNFIEGVDDPEFFRVELATPYATTMGLLNALQDKRPECERFGMGTALARQDEATTIEQACESVMENFPWAPIVDCGLIEAIAGVQIIPNGSAWWDTPDLDDDDVKEERLTPKRFARDASGRSQKEAEDAGDEFSEDEDQSVKTWQQAKDDHLMNTDYFSFRPLSISDAIPLFGPDGQTVEGTIIAQKHSVIDLVGRKYSWKGLDSLLTPIGPADGDDSGADRSTRSYDKEVTMYEYIGYDQNRDVIVCYQIDGKTTSNADMDSDGGMAVINLTKRYGIRRLPVVWGFGPHYWASDPDQRTVPFTSVFRKSFQAANAIATGITIATWMMGFPMIFGQIDPNDVNTAQTPQPVTLTPMSYTETTAKITQLQITPASASTFQMIELLLGNNQEAGPPPAALGGGGDISAISKTVSRRYLEDTLSQLLENMRKIYAHSASIILEFLCASAILKSEAGKKPMPVRLKVLTEVPVAGASRTASDILEFSPLIARGNYQMNALYPVKPGENLALAAQLFGFFQGGGIDWMDWRAWAFGDPAPEKSYARLLWFQYLQKQGMLEVVEEAKAQLGDKEAKDRYELAAKGEIGPGGVPLAMLAGGAPPGGMGLPGEAGNAPPGAMPTVGTGPGAGVAQPGAQAAIQMINPAQNSLAGTIGGAMNADRAGSMV